MLWKRVRELKGRNEDKGAAEGKEEVSGNIGIKGQLCCESHEQSTDGKEYAADDAADSRTIPIEESTNRKSADICRYGGCCEHEVEPSKIPASVGSTSFPTAKSLPYLLFVARSPQFGSHELILTKLTVYPLSNQDRFYRGISKYDPSCEEAIDNSDSNLDCNPSPSAASHTS